jgi:HEAT repeat protein
MAEQALTPLSSGSAAGPARRGRGGRGPGSTVAAYKGPPTAAELDKAFENLKTFNWGETFPQFREQLGAIEDAVIAGYGNEAARKTLEARLAAVLGTPAPRAAKDYVCRKLTIIGTAASVPALAALLTDKETSHMARYALERIQGPEAAKALRDALAKTSGAEKAGVAGSLGDRRDVDSIASLAGLLNDTDAQIVMAAATALGDIGTAEAAKALQGASSDSEPVKLRIADARLAAAEKLLAAGDRDGAKSIYTSLVANPNKNVKLAATRGLLQASK